MHGVINVFVLASVILNFHNKSSKFGRYMDHVVLSMLYKVVNKITGSKTDIVESIFILNGSMSS